MRFMFQMNILLNLQLFKNISHIYTQTCDFIFQINYFIKFTIIQKTFLTYVYANMQFMFQMNILLNLQLFKNISHICTQTCNLCSK